MAKSPEQIKLLKIKREVEAKVKAAIIDMVEVKYIPGRDMDALTKDIRELKIDL